MLIDFLLRQRCVIRPWLGYQDGADCYGEAEERPCRLQAARQLEGAGRAQGTADAIPARAMMFCTGEVIPARSRVECDGESYVVTACQAAHGWGQAHLEVTLR